MNLRPFKIDIPDAQIEDLKRRQQATVFLLASTRRAALEQPLLLVEDIRAFFRPLR